jgi:hypothetical protein
VNIALAVAAYNLSKMNKLQKAARDIKKQK